MLEALRSKLEALKMFITSAEKKKFNSTITIDWRRLVHTFFDS